MKALPIILTLMLAFLFVGCVGGPRKLIGTNVVGADVDTARESTSTIIQTEMVQRSVNSIEQNAKLIVKEAQVESVVVRGEEIVKEAKTSRLILRDIHANLESIHHRSLGKTYWSRGRIMVMWIVGLVLLGIAVRFVPFFQPVHRAISGVANAVMDMLSGTYDELKEVQLAHIKRTTTIADDEIPPRVEKAIKKASDSAELAAGTKKADAKALWLNKGNDA